MKCKKKCIGLIILLIVIVALLSLPYFFGKATETALKRAIKQIPAEPGVTVAIKSYNRGWLHANAVIQVAFDTSASVQSAWQYQLHNKGKIPPKLYLNIKEKIWHGPIIFAKNVKGKESFFIARSYATGQVVIPENERKQLTGLSIDSFSNSNSILIELSGLIKVHSNLPELVVSSLDKTRRFAIKNFDVNYQMNSDFHKQKGKLTLDQLSYKYDNNEFKVEDVIHQFKLDRVLSHLWTGDSDLKVGLVDVTEQTKTLLRQKAIQLRSYAAIKNNLLNLTIELNAGHLQFHNRVYGPANVNLKIMNLDATALNQLRDLDEQLQGNNLSRQQYFQAISQLTPSLFGHGAQVHVSPCQITTPEGDVNLDLNIAFPNVQKNKQVSIKDLFKSVESQNEITIPKTIVKNALTRYFQDKFAYIQQITGSQAKPALTPEQVDKLVKSKVKALLTNWQQAKYLETQDDNYQVKMQYKNNQLLVNGQVVNQ